MSCLPPRLRPFWPKQSNLKFVRLSSGTITDEIIKLVPKGLALEHKIVPIQKGQGLTVAASALLDMFALDNMRFALNSDIEVVLVVQDELNQAIAKYYRRFGGRLRQHRGRHISDIKITQRDGKGERSLRTAPIIRLVLPLFRMRSRPGQRYPY